MKIIVVIFLKFESLIFYFTTKLHTECTVFNLMRSHGEPSDTLVLEELSTNSSGTEGLFPSMSSRHRFTRTLLHF